MEFWAFNVIFFIS